MKRWLAVVPLGLALWAVVQTSAPPRPAAWTPPGALLYLEARNLAGLIADWNSSAEKAMWLASPNYQVFSRSRLFYRLEQMQKEYAASAGVPASMPLLESLAGSESALALYDIGEMHFLYLTRLEAARALESALWRAGAKFETRSSAGKPYFLRREPGGRREAAFAAADGWALISTREELLAQALALMSGERRPALESEAWYKSALSGGGPAGEVRMALNLPALGRSPHFRSYWIQRNAAELREFPAALVDLHRSPAEIREERRLVRAQEETARQGAGLGQLLRLAPPEAGLVRAWAGPSVDEALSLLARKTLAAPVEPRPPRPGGGDDDFDVLVDEPPPPDATPRLRAEALRKLFEATGVEAALVVESSRRQRDGLFVSSDRVVALLGGAEWGPQAVRAALGEAVQGLYTLSGLGLEWRERKAGERTFHETSGLARLAAAVLGRTLLVANSPEALTAVMARAAAPAAADGPVYVSTYRHGRELDNFARLARMIDHPALPAEEPRAPMFFSENLLGLGRTLGRVDTVSLSVRDEGTALRQSVVYRLAR